MLSAAIVLFELEDLRALEVFLEAQDHAVIAAAPGVDRLIVVADDRNVAVVGGQQRHEAILRDIDVLILVDQHVLEALLVLAPGIRVAFQQIDRTDDQIVEIERVGLGQAALVFLIDVADALAQECGLLLEILLRPNQRVLGFADFGEHRARRDLPLVVIEIVENFFDDLALIAVVDDDEARRDADTASVAAQDAHAHRVERADPQVARGRSDHAFEPALHFAGGFVREGDREYAIGVDAFLSEQIRDAVGKDSRLSASGSGEN